MKNLYKVAIITCGICVHTAAIAQGWNEIVNRTKLTFDQVIFWPSNLKKSSMALDKPLAPEDSADIAIPEYGKPLTLELITKNNRKAFIRNVKVHEDSTIVIYTANNKIGVQINTPKNNRFQSERFEADWRRMGLK